MGGMAYRGTRGRTCTHGEKLWPPGPRVAVHHDGVRRGRGPQAPVWLCTTMESGEAEAPRPPCGPQAPVWPCTTQGVRRGRGPPGLCVTVHRAIQLE